MFRLILIVLALVLVSCGEDTAPDPDMSLDLVTDGVAVEVEVPDSAPVEAQVSDTAVPDSPPPSDSSSSE